MNKLLMVVMLLVPLYGYALDNRCNKMRGISYCLQGVDTEGKCRAVHRLILLTTDIWGNEAVDGIVDGTTITFIQGTPAGLPCLTVKGKHWNIYLSRLNMMDFMNILFEASHEFGHVYLGANSSKPHHEAFCSGLSYLTLRHAERVWKRGAAWVGQDYAGGPKDEEKAKAGKEFWKKVDPYIQSQIVLFEKLTDLTAEQVMKLDLNTLDHDKASFYGFLLARSCKTRPELMEKLGIKQRFPNATVVSKEKKAETARQMAEYLKTGGK